MIDQYISVNPCEIDPSGSTTPCQNGGMCTGFSAQEEVSVAYYICTCTGGWTGTKCEVPVGGQIPNPEQVKCSLVRNPENYIPKLQ